MPLTCEYVLVDVLSGRVSGAAHRTWTRLLVGRRRSFTDGGTTPTRFPTTLTSVHQCPPPFATCANTPTVNAGERLRTGVNEPRSEPTPCRAAWPAGPAIGGGR